MDWKGKLRDYIGISIFLIGACTVDASQFIGAVMVLAGMSIIIHQAKKEGMWR